MNYVTHTSKDVKDMLQVLGKNSIDELFATIPKAILDSHPSFDAPGLTEQEVSRYFQGLAGAIRHDNTLFVGAGAYNHFTPSIVSHILSRAEFYTAYTPYQAEVSQGTLQSIFEFQSLMAELTGMEIANASLYEGASAAAETVLMAYRLAKGKKKTLLVSALLHPEYLQTIRTYTRHLGLSIQSIGFRPDGTLDTAALNQAVTDDVFAIIYGSPNFFGIIEDHQAINAVKGESAKTICMIQEITSLGLLQPPAAFGCDICAGEAQGLGLPLGFGGPYLGFLSTSFAYVRELPGRLAGATTDEAGNRGFVLTLATREQHIRREKATSNICTNQALCALAATIYLAVMGKGLADVARQSHRKARYFASLYKSSNGLRAFVLNALTTCV